MIPGKVAVSGASFGRRVRQPVPVLLGPLEPRRLRRPRAWPAFTGRAADALRVTRRFSGLTGHCFASLAGARRIASIADRPSRRKAQATALSRISAELCRLHGFRIVVSGPVPEGPVVIVANHLSYLDPLVLVGTLPCIPIAKREVAGWPLFGAVARAHGVLFVERGDAWSGARALRAARRAIEAGVSVLNFPEGTTTTGESVLPFRRGIFGVARLTGTPVVPVALQVDERELCWTGSQLFLPHYLATARRPSSVVRVHFGCAMTPARYGSAEDLANEAQAVASYMLQAA
jgi:1-acyl-sn-glycerol-3-phosphate acyltransferase